jgi:hypothetical protein
MDAALQASSAAPGIRRGARNVMRTQSPSGALGESREVCHAMSCHVSSP